VHVERWQIFAREGFDESEPEEVFDVRPAGRRVHHTEQVFDHYETEYYTEHVQTGVRSESYVEHVACGQTCTPIPQNCRETCTSNKNGFATCQTTCSGGGQTCSTRYCDETRFRQVPQYADVQRSRQIPRYRSEPRYAMWYSWRVWDWGLARDVPVEGRTTDTSWPTDAEVGLGRDAGRGERERARREESYLVTFTTTDGTSFDYHARSEQEFARFPLGSLHRLRLVGGQLAEILENAPDEVR
jgi:hypothetical protein